jgi:2-hydroxychromene-2-carboxylate isomerase
MAREIEFIFDFASLNAYLAFRALPPILERTNARLTITPCLLGGIFKATNNRSPMVAFADIRGKIDYEMLEIQRFVAKHGLVNYRLNPHFPVNTLLLMRAFIAAQDRGEEAAFLETGLKGLWEEGLKLDDPAALARRIAEAGLNAEQLLADAQRPEVKQRLIDNTESAVKRGVFGMPTFFVGNEMFFGKERLGQVEEELRRAA